MAVAEVGFLDLVSLFIVLPAVILFGIVYIAITFVHGRRETRFKEKHPDEYWRRIKVPRIAQYRQMEAEGRLSPDSPLKGNLERLEREYPGCMRGGGTADLVPGLKVAQLETPRSYSGRG